MGLVALGHVEPSQTRDWICVPCIDWWIINQWTTREVPTWTIFKVFNLLEYCFCFLFWFFGHEACGILAPQPGMGPVPPASEDKVLTTGPPGKSPTLIYLIWQPQWPFSFSPPKAECCSTGEGIKERTGASHTESLIISITSSRGSEWEFQDTNQTKNSQGLRKSVWPIVSSWWHQE